MRESSINLRDLLATIHEKACEALLAKLDDPENLTAADLNSILGFLKHNGITAVPAEGSPLARLNDKASTFAFPFAPPTVAGSLLPSDDPVVLEARADKEASTG